jgi:hypothetical protein
MPSDCPSVPLDARRPTSVEPSQRRIGFFYALFILVLLGAQILSSLIYSPPAYAAGRPTPPVAHGSLTFQQFLKQGRPDGIYHGSFIRPRKSPAVPISKGKGTDYAHLPPSSEPATMKPISQPLTTAFLTGASGSTSLDLKSSDGRLEIQLSPGSLDLSHATVAIGGVPQEPFTLHITQQYGNFAALVDVLGTYTLQVLDSTGKPVSGILLRTPVTFIYHYQPKELFDLNLDADHLSMTWPGLIATAQKAKRPTTNLIILLQ